MNGTSCPQDEENVLLTLLSFNLKTFSVCRSNFIRNICPFLFLSVWKNSLLRTFLFFESFSSIEVSSVILKRKKKRRKWWWCDFVSFFGFDPKTNDGEKKRIASFLYDEVSFFFLLFSFISSSCRNEMKFPLKIDFYGGEKTKNFSNSPKLQKIERREVRGKESRKRRKWEKKVWNERFLWGKVSWYTLEFLSFIILVPAFVTTKKY